MSRPRALAPSSTSRAASGDGPVVPGSTSSTPIISPYPAPLRRCPRRSSSRRKPSTTSRRRPGHWPGGRGTTGSPGWPVPPSWPAGCRRRWRSSWPRQSRPGRPRPTTPAMATPLPRPLAKISRSGVTPWAWNPQKWSPCAPTRFAPRPRRKGSRTHRGPASASRRTRQGGRRSRPRPGRAQR